MSIFDNLKKGVNRVYVGGKKYLIEPTPDKPKRKTKAKSSIHAKSRLGRLGSGLRTMGSNMKSNIRRDYEKYLKEKPKKRRTVKKTTTKRRSRK